MRSKKVLSPRIVSFLSFFTLLSLSGCGEGEGFGPARIYQPVATRVSVSPEAATLEALGATTQFSASVEDQSGEVMTGASVLWISSDPSVASIDSTGLGTALDIGSTTITAASGSASGAASLTVSQVIASVTVSPASHTMISGGGTVQLSVSVGDANGNQIQAAAVEWTSSDPDCAQADGNGLVTSGKAGNATITATSGGVTGTAEITVLLPPVATVEIVPLVRTIGVGATLQLTAITRDALGSVLTGRTVTWASENRNVASVTPSGLVAGLAPGGPVTITATSEGKSATALVTVSSPVASVTVAPDVVTLAAGETQALTATLRDAANNVLSGRVVSWSTSNGGIATVSPSGVVTSVAAGGPVTITARSEGVSGTALITVTPAPVALLAAGPANR